MDSFGLGLVLNFTDNATAGMQRASQTFRQMDSLSSQLVKSSTTSVERLTMLSYGMNQLGSQMVGAGKAITGAFAGFGKEMISVGGTLFAARMQLGMLYGSANAGEAVIGKVKDFAKKSVFEFQDLLNSVLRMKSVSIEAFDEVSSSSGRSRQNMLEYAGDLSAFNPMMRNIYGTGIQAAMGSIIEYVAEGNAMSLKRGAGLDITAILGEDKGKSMEERSRQVADLLEQLNMVGAVRGLEGTASQQLSNLSDVVFNLKAAVTDSGVFEKYTELVNQFASAIFAIPQDKLDRLAEVIGDLLVSLMEPLSVLIEKATTFITWLIDYVIDNPGTVKLIATLVGIGGAALYASGFLLRLSSSATLIGIAFGQMTRLSTVNGVFRGIGSSAGTLLTKMLPLVGIGALIYTAWSKNLFGLKDKFQQSWGEFAQIVSLVWDGVSDRVMGEDKIKEAEGLGIMPFISSIVDLRYNLEDMFGGITDGFNSFFEDFNKMGEIEMGDGSIVNVFDKLSGFIDKFTGSEAQQKWTNIGTIIGKSLGVLALFYPILRLVTSRFALIGFVGYLAFQGVSKAIEKVNEVLAENPELAQKFKSNFDTMGLGFSGLYDNIHQAWGIVKDGIQPGDLEALKNMFLPNLTTISDGFKGIWSNVGELGAAILGVEYDEEKWNNIGNAILNVAKFGGLAFLAIKAFQITHAIIAPLLNPLVLKLAGIAGLGVAAFSWARDEMETDPVFAGKINTSLDSITTGLTTMKESAIQAYDYIKAGNISDEEWAALGDKFTKGFSLALSGVGSLLLSLLQQAISNFNTWIGSPEGKRELTNVGVAIGEIIASVDWIGVFTSIFQVLAGFLDGVFGTTKFTDYFFPESGRYGNDNYLGGETTPISLSYEELLQTGFTSYDKAVRIEDTSNTMPWAEGVAEYITGAMFQSNQKGSLPGQPDYHRELIAKLAFPPEVVDAFIEKAMTEGLSFSRDPISGLTFGRTDFAEKDLFNWLYSTAYSPETLTQGNSLLPRLTVNSTTPYSDQIPLAYDLSLSNLPGYTSLTEEAGKAEEAVKGVTDAVEALDGKTSNVTVSISVNDPHNVLGFSFGGGGGGVFHGQTALLHAEGGVFSQPTLLRSNSGVPHVVGEAGEEAIMPLNALWGQMDTKVRNAVSGSNSTINFSPGSIVMNVANASPAEMQRAAREMVDYIEREQRLRNLAKRKVGA